MGHPNEGLDAPLKKELVLKTAVDRGAKWGIVGGALSTAAVTAAHRYSPWFRRSTSVSSRVALAVSPLFLLFPLVTELTMNRAMLNPKAYGIVAPGQEELKEREAVPRSGLQWYHKTANHLYTHPFQMIGGMGVPAVGYIAWTMRDEGHLKLSQKIMHTRVLGQMTVLSILVTTMMFRDYMAKQGGEFVDEGHQESAAAAAAAAAAAPKMSAA